MFISQGRHRHRVGHTGRHSFVPQIVSSERVGSFYEGSTLTANSVSLCTSLLWNGRLSSRELRPVIIGRSEVEGENPLIVFSHKARGLIPLLSKVRTQAESERDFLVLSPVTAFSRVSSSLQIDPHLSIVDGETGRGREEDEEEPLPTIVSLS